MAQPGHHSGSALRALHLLAHGVAGLLCSVTVLAGVALLVLPAFGWMPGLGHYPGDGLPLLDLLQQPGVLRGSLSNLGIGLAATVLSVAVSFLMIAAGWESRWFGWVRRALPPLLALPHASAALGAVLLLASSGFAARIAQALTGLFPQPPDWRLVHEPYGLLLILVLAFKEIPFLLLLGIAALSGLPVHQSQMQMRVTGYGQVAGMLLVLGPLLYARLRLPVLIVLAYAVSVSDMAILIGPNFPAPLSVQVLQWLSDPDLRHRFLAAAGALLLVGISGLALLIWVALERISGLACRFLLNAGFRMRGDGWLRLGAGGLGWGLMAGGIGIYGLLGLWSVARSWSYSALLPRAVTLDTWQSGLQTLSAPLAATLQIAGLSALLSLCLAILLLWLQTFDRKGRPVAAGYGLPRLVFLPLLLPQIATLSGLRIVLLMTGATPGLAILVIAHMIFVFPYIYLSLREPWQRLDPRFEQLAQTLGKSPLVILVRVRLALLLAPLLSALALGFAVSTALYVPTVILGAGRITTVVTEAVALGSGGDRRMIGVYAFLQAMLSIGPFALALAIPALHWRNRRGMRAL